MFLGGETIEKFFDEYDPLHPNEYEKLTRKDKEERDKRSDADRLLFLIIILHPCYINYISYFNKEKGPFHIF